LLSKVFNDSIKLLGSLTSFSGKYNPLSGANPFITAFLNEVGAEL
jgi:hypothetical protein